MLLFNQEAGYAIGLDLGVNYLLGVLTDLQGNILYQDLLRWQVHSLPYEDIQSHLFTMIDLLIETAPPSPYGIVGIGIGVPGTVSHNGNVLLAPNLGWKGIELQAVLEKKYNLPVTVENEANAGAYGEKNFGAGKEHQHVVYVSVGMGIGSGLILNNELYRGNHGLSGEIGHMTVEAYGKECRCGNDGCWELYASERSLLNRAAELGIADSEEAPSLESLISLADNGDAATIGLFEEIGDYLGIGINNIINIFNPDQVIIGNRMATAERWLKPSLLKKISSKTQSFFQKDLAINFSELSTHSAALGVAAFSVQNFFGQEVPQLAILHTE